jgi:hypothetical protein
MWSLKKPGSFAAPRQIVERQQIATTAASAGANRVRCIADSRKSE